MTDTPARSRRLRFSLLTLIVVVNIAGVLLWLGMREQVPTVVYVHEDLSLIFYKPSGKASRHVLPVKAAKRILSIINKEPEIIGLKSPIRGPVGYFEVDSQIYGLRSGQIEQHDRSLMSFVEPFRTWKHPILAQMVRRLPVHGAPGSKKTKESAIQSALAVLEQN